MTGNGNTLVAGSTNTAKTVAEQFAVFPVKYPSDFGSKSAKCGCYGWYFALKDGHTLGELVPSGSSFTLSVRMAYNFDGVGVTFGDPENNAKNVRFGDTGCPRVPYWYVGSSSSASYGDGGLHGWNDSTDPNVIGAWSAYTLVYDAASKTYEMYRDGCRVKCGAATVSMDAKGLWLGWNGRTGANAVYKGLYLKFDDITIWNQVLTPAEVARHVRALQHSADGQYAAEAARSVLPTNVAVTVDADAKIRFRTGADHVVKSLALALVRSCPHLQIAIERQRRSNQPSGDKTQWGQPPLRRVCIFFDESVECLLSGAKTGREIDILEQDKSLLFQNVRILL